MGRAFVLHIEDDKRVTEALHGAMGAIAADVSWVVARSRCEALARVEARMIAFNAMIVGCVRNVPNVGLDVLRIARLRGIRVPAVLLSAHADLEVALAWDLDACPLTTPSDVDLVAWLTDGRSARARRLLELLQRQPTWRSSLDYFERSTKLGPLRHGELRSHLAGYERDLIAHFVAREGSKRAGAKYLGVERAHVQRKLKGKP